MMSAVRRVACRLRSESGFSLPEVIVSVIVNMVAIGIISTSVITSVSLQMNLAAIGGATGAAALTDSSWRAAVDQASTFIPTDDSEILITRPGADSCISEVWSMSDADGSRALTVTTTVYPDHADGMCTGTPTAPKTRAPIPSIGPTSKFLFENIAGRGMTFTDGVPTLATGQAPDGVSGPEWASTTIGLATLRTDVLNADATLHLTSSQIPGQLNRPSTDTDAPASYVTPVAP